MSAATEAVLVPTETTALADAFLQSGSSPPAQMDSESLGSFVQKQVVLVHTTLIALKPYIDELWRRFDNGETILGCKTRKEFCLNILDRTPRAVRYMLAGGNPATNRKPTNPGNGHPIRNHPPCVGSVEGKHVSAELWLEPCSRTDLRYEDIREDHYVENHGCIGRQAHFLIQYKGEIAGIISGASPVYATALRDNFFGLNHRNRKQFLQGIVNNTVFRLENHEPNLATRVLALWRKVIPHFWYEQYGTVVYGFETFVVENKRRKGSLYLADNWTHVGTTAGATKIRNGIEKPADNWKEVTPKLIFCKWREGFEHPCSAETPEAIRRLYPDIARSSEEQPWKQRAISTRHAAAGPLGWSKSPAGMVSIDELPEDARKRVLAQIEGAQS